jgi:site-specific DNA recombinase
MYEMVTNMKDVKGSIDLSGELRGAMYGRFSSDMQRPASLEDQERDCRELIGNKKWVVAEDFVESDAAISGTSLLNRPGIRRLVLAAKMRPRPFDCLVIDDTSRLTRNLGDILKLAEMFEHHCINLYFVTQKLDSRDENFRTMLTWYGLFDEQSVKRLGKAVHRGQAGRVLAGYTSGSRCFGYKSVREQDPSRIGETGRNATLGTRLEVLPDEALTILRIGEMFADGVSVHQIQKILTAEKVPAARKPRIGDVPSSWNSCLINRILRNQKYMGVVLWNRTKQFRDPETGLVETRQKLQDEIIRVEVPHLRIIPKGLWDRIQARIKIVDEKVKPHRLGGMNKSENKTYLFSGLLECGVCGGPIIITGGKGSEASYGCRAARYQRGCTNRLRVRADRFTVQLIEALAQRVLTPDYLEVLTESVCRELNAQYDECRKRAIAAGTHLPQRKLELETQVRRLVDAIATMELEQSTALRSRVASLSDEIRDVNRQLRIVQTDTKPEVSTDEVKMLVAAMANDLMQLCLADVAKAKSIMQKHIDCLILIPTDTPDGPVYEVTGAMEMFPASDVVLDHGSTRTIQHYDSFKFGFAGIIVDPRREGDNEEPPVNAAVLTDLLIEVLRNRPYLRGELLTARDWRSNILAATADHGFDLNTVLHPKYMTWLVVNYGRVLGHELEVKIVINSQTKTKSFSFRLLEAREIQTPREQPMTLYRNVDSLEAA